MKKSIWEVIRKLFGMKAKSRVEVVYHVVRNPTSEDIEPLFI